MGKREHSAGQAEATGSVQERRLFPAEQPGAIPVDRCSGCQEVNV